MRNGNGPLRVRNGNGPLRVLLCDDAAELRTLVRAALEEGGEITVVGEAGDGERALRLAAQTHPDVVLVDLDMPGPGPSALLVALPVVAPSSAIVTYSGHEPRRVVASAVASEVALHLPKTTELPAIRQALIKLGEKNSS
jgi:DNA-binding NarL/FixJ family response regulator